MSRGEWPAGVDRMPASERDTQPAARRPNWRVNGPQCECDASLSTWYAPAAARRLVRVYGTDGRVSTCPNCQEPRAGTDALASVPTAITRMRPTASIERLSPNEQLAVMTRPEVKR